MQQIIISANVLILSISFIFGILAFAEWNINSGCWDVGTRIIGSMFYVAMFAFWIAYVMNTLMDRNINAL